MSILVVDGVRVAYDVQGEGPPVLAPDPVGLLGEYAANEAWAEHDHLDERAGLHMPALAIAAEFCNAFPPADVSVDAGP